MNHKHILSFLLVIIVGCSRAPSLGAIRQTCLPIQHKQSLIQLENGLILAGKETYILREKTKTHISNVQEDDKYYVDISSVMVAPNGEKAAYIATRYLNLNGSLSYVDESLKILSSNGTEIEVAEWVSASERPIEWFDNENLLISPTDHSDGTVILLNSLTYKKRVFPSKLLDIYKLDQIPWYKGVNPLPIYNSAMTHVFYLRDSAQGMEFALNDLGTGETLWSGIVHNPTNRPLWSPVDDKVLIAIPQSSPSDFEFYIIDKNGLETKLSNFGSLYPFTYINGFNWSPDGQYIGFWLDARTNESDYSSRFAIFDLKNKQTTDYCVGPGGGPIVWSPSGNQVALQVADKENPSLFYTVVIDIQKKVMVEVSDQEYPVGWMKVK